MERAARLELQRASCRLAEGERATFPDVYARAWPELRSFVGRHVPPTDAEDVAQQVLLNVFARAAEFDSRRDALTWLLGIAAFELKTRHRRVERRREEALQAEHVSALSDSSPSPEERAMEADLQAALVGALGELEDSDRRTLWEWSGAVGERAAVPPATFRKRAQRALTRFRAAWRTNHGDG